MCLLLFSVADITYDVENVIEETNSNTIIIKPASINEKINDENKGNSKKYS